MTTAEYAGGRVCTAMIGCGLVALVDIGWFTDMFERLFDAALTRPLPYLLGWVS